MSEPDDNQGADIPTADIEQIGSDLSATMPDVQEHAIAQEQSDEKEKLARNSHYVDRDGNPFDSDIHRADKDGNPVLSPKNKLIKKPGRKSGGKNESASKPQNSSVIGSAVDKNEQQRVMARTTGKAAANMMFTLGVGLGGEEWKPVVDEKTGTNERDFIECAFADYFEATGKTDLPPGVVLTFAITMYCGPRLFMPKTKERVGGAFGRIKKWWVNRKLKKHGLKAVDSKDGARDDPRSDPQRQNNAR